eukprot:1142459-Pelagomonas_calceolata.AAC.9
MGCSSRTLRSCPGVAQAGSACSHKCRLGWERLCSVRAVQDSEQEKPSPVMARKGVPPDLLATGKASRLAYYRECFKTCLLQGAAQI